VNEFLTQLETVRGVVACTTNLWHDLDAAALRRFVFKVEFQYPSASLLIRMLAAEASVKRDSRARALGFSLGRSTALQAGERTSAHSARSQELDV
jgi:hypothetical protein